MAALLALVPMAASAQEAPPEAPETPKPGTVQEIVEIEHADVRVLARVLGVFQIYVQAQPELGVIALRGSKEDVEVAAAAARRLDVPPERSHNVEVTAHVLGASKDRDLPGGVPAPLDEVAHQLREVFGYRGVRLLDSLVLRARDRSRGQIKGVLSGGPGAPPIPYELGFNRVTVVDGGEGPEVRLDGLLFEARIGPPDPPAATEGPNAPRVRSDVVRLVTDLDVREGQKAVVGKAASGGEGREALIVVIEVSVTD